MVELSIIIVNWNTKNLLRECINSIYVNKPPFPYEILVVDNASSDGSQEMIKTLFLEVILIENSSNLGYSKAKQHRFQKFEGKFYPFFKF
ncbi:MAG: glycosyltransferase [Candidatus Aminicenantia bacterium]